MNSNGKRVFDYPNSWSQYSTSSMVHSQIALNSATTAIPSPLIASVMSSSRHTIGVMPLGGWEPTISSSQMSTFDPSESIYHNKVKIPQSQTLTQPLPLHVAVEFPTNKANNRRRKKQKSGPPLPQQSSLLSALQQYDDSKTYKQAQVSFKEMQFIKALQSVSDPSNNALIKQILPGLIKHIRLLKTDRNSYTNICYHEGWTDLEPLRNTSVTVTNSVQEISDGVYRFAGFINHAASYVGGRDGKFSIYRCKLRDKDSIYVWFLANNCVGDKGSLALTLDHQEQLHYFSSSVGATSFDHVTTPVNKFFCMTAKNMDKPCNIQVTVNHYVSGSAGAINTTADNSNNNNASFTLATTATSKQSTNQNQAIVPNKLPQVKCTTLQSFIGAHTSIVNLLQKSESSAEKHQTVLSYQDEIVRYLKTLRSVPTSQLINHDDTHLQRNSLIGNSKLLVSNADAKLSKINGLYNFMGLLNGSGHYVKKFNSGNKCEIFKCKLPTYVTNIGTANEAAPQYIWLLVDRTKDQANVTDGLLMYFSLCDSNSTDHSYPDSNANWYGAYNTTGGGVRSNQLSVFVSTTPGAYQPSAATYEAFAAAGAQALSAAKASQQAIAARLPSSVLSHSLVNCSVPVSRLPDTATITSANRSNNNGTSNSSNSISDINSNIGHMDNTADFFTGNNSNSNSVNTNVANSDIINTTSVCESITVDQIHLPDDEISDDLSLDFPVQWAYSPAYSPAPENEPSSPLSSHAAEITTQQQCVGYTVDTTVTDIDTILDYPTHSHSSAPAVFENVSVEMLESASLNDVLKPVTTHTAAIVTVSVAALENSGAFELSPATATQQLDQSNNTALNHQLITLLVEKFPTLTRSNAKRAMLQENARIAVELNLPEQTVAEVTVLFSKFMLGLQELFNISQAPVSSILVSNVTLSGDYDEICVSILTVLFRPLPADVIESSLMDLMIDIEAVSDCLVNGVAIVPIYCYCMMLKQYL